MTLRKTIAKKGSRGCPFCGSSASDNLFAASPHFVALYNIAPIVRGHSLVVPRRHVTSLMELNEDELAEFMIFGRDVARLLLKKFRAKSFNWTIQEGKDAGQTVPHLHMHIIPRISGDFARPGDWYHALRKQSIDSDSRPRLASRALARVVAELRKAADKREGK